MQTEWEKPSTQTSKCCTSDKALNVKPVLIQKPATKCHLSSLFRSQDLYIHSVLETNWIIVYGAPKKKKKKNYKFNLLYLKHRRSSTVGQSQTFVKPVKLDEFHGKKKKRQLFVNNHCKGIFTMFAGGIYSQHRVSETCTHDITVGPFQSQFATKLTEH